MDDPSLGIAATRHRFFKGCTRPPMFMGIPLLPFLMVAGLMLIACMWAMTLASGYVSLFVLAIGMPVLATMRQVSKKDDQRLRQIMLRMRMRFRHANKAHWHALSYAPLRYKVRRP